MSTPPDPTQIAVALYVLRGLVLDSADDVAAEAGVRPETAHWAAGRAVDASPDPQEIDTLLDHLGYRSGGLRADRVHVWYCGVDDPHLGTLLDALRPQQADAPSLRLAVSGDRAALPNPILCVPCSGRKGAADAEAWVVLEGAPGADDASPNGSGAPSAGALCRRFAFLQRTTEPRLAKSLDERIASARTELADLRTLLLDGTVSGDLLPAQLIALRAETQRNVGKRAELKTAQISAWLKDPKYLSAARARRLMADLGLVVDIDRGARWLLGSDAIHYWTLTPQTSAAFEDVLAAVGEPALRRASLTVDAHPGKRGFGLLKVPNQSRRRTAWIVLESIPGLGGVQDIGQALKDRVASFHASETPILRLLRGKGIRPKTPPVDEDIEPDRYIEAVRELLDLRAISVGALAEMAELANDNHLYQWLGKSPDATGISAEQVRRVLEAIDLRGNRLAADVVHDWYWSGRIPRVSGLLGLIDSERRATAQIFFDPKASRSRALLILKNQAWGDEAWVELHSRYAHTPDEENDVLSAWCALFSVEQPEPRANLVAYIEEHRKTLAKRAAPEILDRPADLTEDLALFMKRIFEERTRLLGNSVGLPFSPRHDSVELRRAVKAAVMALDADTLQPLLGVLAAAFEELTRTTPDHAEQTLLEVLQRRLQHNWLDKP